MDDIGFFVRVNAYEGYEEKIRMLVTCSDYRSVFAVRHMGKQGENMHYHIIIVTRIQPQAFRVRMKKIFDKGKGNEHMSIKRFDGCEDTYAYCFHEDEAELLVHEGVSSDLIARARQRNEAVQLQIKDSKAKASWTLEEDCVQHFKDWPYIPSEREVADRLVRIALDKGKYVPNPFLARQIICNIRFRLCDGDLSKEDIVVRSIVERIVPQ